MIKHRTGQTGISLIEMLLVMVVISAFLVMGTSYLQQRATRLQIDKTSAQIQQIINASIAYYIINGAWPNMTTLVGSHYFTSTPKSPWISSNAAVGQYYIGQDPTSLNLYVWTEIDSSKPGAAAGYTKVIAGELPFAYVANPANAPRSPGLNQPPGVSTCTGTPCTVVAYATVPPQNLNKAKAINFGGLYHHGACVPVPSCPVDAGGTTMVPSVFIVPTSVSGVSDAVLGSTAVYPISSFTGYATGGTDSNPPNCDGATDADTPSCPTTTPVSKYWRACVDLVTERGDVSDTGSTGKQSWGQYVTVTALTRCAGANEESGSNFSVFSN
jgi:type II secretory pathway pseudopilin PulG